MKAPHKLTVVIPCFNERNTLESCIESVLRLRSDALALEIIIVDDCSTDGSLSIAEGLADRHPEIRLFRHEMNRGKGAALRTGFAGATGDFVAVQDADLEYNPLELPTLLKPLVDGQADVVYGSRFMGGNPHRVLYFWHSLGNKFLTLLSNMFTDLNLTDMETCYKVFRRKAIQGIAIEEDRFGFEPEITAKIAARRLRIYEMGISYSGRTYEEGKKIGWRDGLRALYCIVRYSAPRMPMPMQFLIYLFIGGFAALVNLGVFLLAIGVGIDLVPAAVLSFLVAAAVNYFLCIATLFRHKARWDTPGELAAYMLVVAAAGVLEVGLTRELTLWGIIPGGAKAIACTIGTLFNFLARRQFVFREKHQEVPAAIDADG